MLFGFVNIDNKYYKKIKKISAATAFNGEFENIDNNAILVYNKSDEILLFRFH